MKPFEPWTRFVELTVIPPISLWFNFQFEGLEQIPSEGPALVACNHISYFDPLAHGYFVEKAGRRPRYFTKVELYKNPFLRRVLTGAKQIPVVRGSGDRTPVEAAQKALKAGELVVVYPEGTITKNADHSPMQGKTGVARLTLASEVPVIPIAIWGSQSIWQREGRGSLKFGRPIWLKAGTPLDFSEYEDRPDDPETIHRVTDSVMAELSVLVDDLRGRYPKKWA